MAVPILWTRRRILTLAGLATLGAVQALAVLAAALAGSRLLASPDEGPGKAWLLKAVVAATIVLISSRILQRRFAEAFALNYIAELRVAFMSHVLRVPAGSREMSTGLVMTRVVNDLSAIKLWLADGLIAIVVGAGLLVTAGGLAAWFQPDLLLPLAAAFAIWCVPVLLSLRPLERRVRESRYRRGRIAARAGQILGARLTLLSLGRHGPAVRGLNRRSGKLNSALVKRATMSGLMRSSGDLIFPSVAVFVAAGSLYGNAGRMDAVMLGVLVMMTGIIATNLGAIALGLEYRIAYRVSLARLESILHVPVLDLDEGEPIERRSSGGSRLMVEDLSLESSARPLSFTVPAAERVYLSGLSDSQSSELALRLARLRQVGGSIMIDDAKCRQSRLRHWWRTVAVVSPHLPLMHSSIEANAQMGSHSSISDKERVRVFEAFGLTPEALARLAGQTEPVPAQIATATRAARAVLRRCPVVVVDDPGLVSDAPLFGVFLQELQAFQATVVVVGKTVPSKRLSLRTIELGLGVAKAA